MIEVVDLKKSFGDTEILKGITTTLESGKINLIIGQSGSGKTVFLKSLLNVFEPTSGSILFDGRNIVEMTPKQKQDHQKFYDNIEYVYQNILTVLEGEVA